MNSYSFSDSDVPPKRKILRSTVSQIEFFIRYMAANPDLLKSSHSRPPDIAKKVDMKWIKLKNILKQYGPDKKVLQWKHTWRDLVKKVRKKQSKGESSKDGELIMKALENAKKFSFHNIEPWTVDKLWIPLDKSRLTVAVKSVKQEVEDPLVDGSEGKSVQYFLEVGLLNDNPQNQPRENGQIQETQEGLSQIPLLGDEQNNPNLVRSDYERAESPASSRSTLPSPTPRKKQKRTSYPVSEELGAEIAENDQEDVQETSDSGQYNRDSDVLNTLNKFIEYEKEKDKQQHEREMTRIKQADKLLDVMDKIANVFVDLAPSKEHNTLPSSKKNCNSRTRKCAAIKFSLVAIAPLALQWRPT